MNAPADLLAATAAVIRSAEAGPLKLPDISRATLALEGQGPPQVHQGECPALVGELLRAVPIPRHDELAALLHALLDAAPALIWTDPYADQPDHRELRAGYFITTLVAGPMPQPNALLTSADAGVFLTVQAPHLLYPPHSHLAPELYCAVAGAADWQKGNDPFETQPAGAWMVHPPWTSHAMQTRDEPLVALAIWTADLDSVAVFDSKTEMR